MADKKQSPQAIELALANRSTAATYKKQFTDEFVTKLNSSLKNTMPASTGKITSGVKAQPKGQSFWHWLGDIVDRPRRAIGDTIQGIAHESEATAKGLMTGDFSDLPGAIGEQLSAVPRGLFSTAKGDQRTSSEIIEKITDDAGKFDKNYKNTKNNVNPVLKGVAGFVGDVATDPLTYIGGGALVRGGKLALDAAKAGEGAKAAKTLGKAAAEYTGADLVGKGAKAAAGGVKKAATLLKNGRSVTEELAKSGKLNPAEVKEAAAAKAEEAASAIKADSPQVENPVEDVPTGSGAAHGLEQAAVHTAQSEAVAAALKDVPKIPAGMSTAEAMAARVAPKVVAAEHPQVAVTRQALQESKAAHDVALAEAAKRSATVTKLADRLEKAHADEAVSPAQYDALYRAWERADQAEDKAIAVTQQTSDAHNAALAAHQAAKTLPMPEATPVGAAVAPPQPHVEAPVAGGTEHNEFEAVQRPLPPMSVGDQMRAAPNYGTVSKVMEALSKRVAREAADTTGAVRPANEMFVTTLQKDKEGQIASALGPLLMQSLTKMKPERFDATVTKLHSILSDGGHLDTLAAEDELSKGAVGALWKSLGIDAQGTNIARRSAESAINTPEGIIGKLTDVEGKAIEEARATDGVKGGNLEAEKQVAMANRELDAMRVLQETYPKQISEADLAGGRVTASGARTNAKPRGSEESKARFLNILGTHPQWTHFIHMNQRVAERITGKGGIAGAKLARAKREATMAGLRIVEKVLDDAGAPLSMDNGIDRPLNLSLGQMLESMVGKGDEIAKAVDEGLFNGSTGIAPTKLMEAFVALQAGKDDAHVMGILKSGEKREAGKGGFTHFLEGNTEKWGKVDFSLGTKPTEAPEGYRYVDGKKGGYYTEVSNTDLARRLLEGMRASSNELRGVERANAAAAFNRFQLESVEMLDKTKQEVLALVESDADLSKAILAITRPGLSKSIGTTAHEAGARADSAAMADARAEAELPDGAQVNAEAAKTAKAGAEARDAGQTAEARAAVGNEADDIAQQTEDAVEAAMPDLKEESFDVTAKLTSKAYRQTHSSMMAFVDPLAKRFNAGWATEDRLPLYQLQHEPLAIQQDWWGQIKPEINTLTKNFGMQIPGQAPGRTYMHAALEDIARNVESTDPQTIAARAVMEKSLARIFNVGEDGDPVLGAVFGRLGAPVEYLNKQMSMYSGLKDFVIDSEKAADAVAMGTHKSEYAAGLDQWREWAAKGEIKDPVGFLTSMSHLALKATTHASVVDSLGKAMRREGLMAMAGEKAAKGMLKANFSKDSPLAAFWNPDWRVHPDMAPGLQQVNALMTEGTKLHGEHANFLEKYYDPVQRMWKFGMTLPRPGHHFRNLVGDSSMTFLAEGVQQSARASTDAFKVMTASGRKFDDMDFAKALQGRGIEDAGHAQKTLTYGGPAEAIIKNKFGTVDAANVYKALKARGALPEFKNVEQLDSTGVGRLEKFSNKITTDNRFGRAVGKISEGRDHWSRTQHFLQVMHKFEKNGYIEGKWGKKLYPKNMEEAMDFATDRVRQYHPDGTNLTNFEKNVLRRIIPFYSWMRGAIPAVVESGIRNPGRVTVLNKASYNAAVAAGINPDSIYDPFPDDQLFPSFLSQQIQGPQLKINGHYWSISPGLATWDLANTFADPKSGILGSVSPLIRTPIEVATGTQLATGAKIKDPSDYLDQQLPLVSNAANVTGYSPSGTVAGLLQGAGADQQYQTRNGNKSSDDLLASLLSTLTGVQATDTSRPNYIKFAQFEQKNKSKQLDSGQATGF